MDGQNISYTNIAKLLLSGSLFVFPLSLSNYNMIHQSGLDIKFPKNSPPLAIIEDERISFVEEDVPTEDAKNIFLKAVKQKNDRTFLKIAQEFLTHQKEQEKLIQPTQARELAGLTLNKNSPNIQLIKKSLGIQAQHTKIKIVQSTKFSEQKNQIQKPVENTEHLPDPLSEDSDITDARSLQIVDLSTPETFEQRATRTINQYGNIIHETKTEQPVVTQVVGLNLSADEIAKRFANNALTKTKEDTKTKSITQKENPESLSPVRPQNIAARELPKAQKTNNLLAQAPTQALIGGQLEFAEGLALTGNQKINVYRQIAGNKISDGQVFLDKGLFEIYVDNPTTGLVVADMTDGQKVIGRGEILLPEALKSAQRTGQLKNLRLVMKPVQEQIKTQNISAYAILEKNNDEFKVKSTINDILPTKDKILKSIVLNKTTKENYWGTLALGSSSQFFKNILYPDKTIEALQQIVGATVGKAGNGIIRGTVKLFGKTVSGAQLEIDSEKPIRPTYFNAFIPDASLTQTTSNGEYALVDVPDGTYVLRAKYNGKELTPQIVPVESGLITRADFSIDSPSMSEAFIFDLKNSEMITAEIGFAGSDNFVDAEGRKLLSFSGSSGVQFLEARAKKSGYLPTRVTVDKSEKEILIPMVSESWLTELLARLRVNASPEGSILLGTAPEQPYEIELDPKSYVDETSIIYFDKNGYAVEGATSTPPGGGFIAVNVNPGMRSLFVKYAGQSQKKVVTIAADPSVVNVFASKQ